ncbi:glycosyltransferase [Chryseobacterium nepalense]|uniref:Glycosyltransferase n=1 Tax=Chryseobacterium nepalense TaxID=1854498 RepID=A0ABY4K5G2_9FLAO|nr:glycosyltransferase [Chryseobacterium nepalense]UPQ75435.1 glycosyltransferase [Chryseobacterium nepalense]
MNISVCLATYNGEKYIETQINSILPQLSGNDELIIIDDGSKDKTVDIIKSLNSRYIKIFINEKNLGHVKTFEKLLSLAQNQLLFLSDQDDIWIESKIEIYKKYFDDNDVLLISDNSYFIDNKGNEIHANIVKLSKESSQNYSKNIIDIYSGTAGYYGCGMAMKKDILDVILPIPTYIESHDLWIAMAANMMRSNLHIDDKTFYRRIHDENDSLRKRKFFKKIFSRYIFLRSQVEILKRLKKIKR